MSPAARDAAEKLGYTNAKIFHEGIPVWAKANPLSLTPKLLKEAWVDKEQPIVVLDVRKKAKGGVIPGAVAFDGSRKSLDKLYKYRKVKPPIVVYDVDGGKAADAVARAIVKEGHVAMVLAGGAKAWQAAGYALAKGPAAKEIAFVPKPKPGSIPVPEFKAIAAAIPADTVVLDVRNADEVAKGAIAGAVNIPGDQLANRTAELPKDRRIVAHCSTGVRAEMAYHVLKGAGFTRVAYLNAAVDFDGGKPEIGE